MTFRRISYPLVLALTFSILTISIFQSCERDDDDSINGGPPVTETTVTQVIVYTNDPSGGMLAGVSVSIGNTTLTSDNHGIAIFKDITVNKNRFTVKADKQGYFDAVKGAVPGNDKPSHTIRFIMNPLPSLVPTFNTASGGTVTLPSGASVEFSPGSIADALGTPYSGTVNVYTYHFDPTAPDFETQVPGGDLLGLDEDGDEVALVSFGMMQIELRDPSGNLLNLMSGATAEITFPIAASQQATAPTTIPLWYLDESTALWMEEGQATKQGNTYVGNVSHFSFWNCDYPGEKADVTGKVIDCLGNPVANVIVTINGFMNVTTNGAGEFSTWVPAGWSITYQVLTLYNPWLQANSNLVTLTATSSQPTQIPDFVVNCASRLVGMALNCEGNPVSGYVYVMAPQANIYFVYYMNQGVLDIIPQFIGQNYITIASTDGNFDTIINVVHIPAQTYNLGTITACGVTPVGGSMNTFVVNGGPFTNELIQMYPVNSQVFFGMTFKEFVQFGYATPDSLTYNLQIDIAGQGGIGSYIVSPNVGGMFTFNKTDYIIDLNGSDYITFNIVSIGPIGGLVTGTFSGSATYTDTATSSSYPVTITSGHIGCTRY